METPKIVHGCWVDDLVLMMVANSPQTLISKTQCALALIHETSVEYALQLNFGCDKTACLLGLRGKGAKTTWSNLLAESSGKPKLWFSSAASSTRLAVDVVTDYMYLGTLIDHLSHPASEVKHRFHSVKPTQKMLRKNIFKSPKVPHTTRRMLFRTLIQSKVLFGAGAWQMLNLHTLDSYISQMMQLIQRITPWHKPGPGVSHLDMLANSEVESPLLMLAVRRLSLFDRVCHSEMTELFAVLQNQPSHNGWFSQIMSDLDHIQLLIPEGPIAEIIPHGDIFLLAQHASQHPKSFANFGKLALKRYIGYLKIWKVVRASQQAIHAILDQYHVHIQESQPHPTPLDGYQCDECHMLFSTFQALCSHTYQKHGQVNVAQRYATGNHCRGCMNYFDSRQQVLHHLKYYRTGCLTKLICTTPPVDDEELQYLLDNDRAI